MRNASSQLDQVAKPGSGRRMGGVREVAQLGGVFKSNVGLGMHAIGGAVRHAQHGAEAELGAARHGGLGLVYDETQVRGARLGHCRVPAEVVCCSLYDRTA